MSLNPPMTVTRRIRSPGRARNKPLKPLRGECRVISGVTVVTTLVCSLHLSHARLRVHRAPGIPCALCYRGPKKIHANLGRLAPWDRGVVLDVIARSDLSAVAQRAKAEATKQSTLQFRGNMDCFAQPVIGRAFARPAGSQ